MLLSTTIQRVISTFPLIKLFTRILTIVLSLIVGVLVAVAPFAPTAQTYSKRAADISLIITSNHKTCHYWQYFHFYFRVLNSNFLLDKIEQRELWKSLESIRESAGIQVNFFKRSLKNLCRDQRVEIKLSTGSRRRKSPEELFIRRITLFFLGFMVGIHFKEINYISYTRFI